jgi:hypothetical protein
MENLLNPEVLKPVCKHPTVQLIYLLKIARKSLRIGDKVFLKLPLFNPETPVYQLKILGRPMIYKDQKYLKFRLKPQEIAFFIHLSLCTSEPGRSISVDEIYKNFFPRVKDAQSRLAHLLVKIRSQLMLWRNLFVIQSS